jgi:hypothetical protein
MWNVRFHDRSLSIALRGLLVMCAAPNDRAGSGQKAMRDALRRA